MSMEAELLTALKTAVKVAGEAADEWDKAPEGMKAGKLLIALSGGLPGYRRDIDAIHAALAKMDRVAALEAANAKLREALKRGTDGWANALELGLIPPNHTTSATFLRDDGLIALAMTVHKA